MKRLFTFKNLVSIFILSLSLMTFSCESLLGDTIEDIVEERVDDTITTNTGSDGDGEDTPPSNGN